jgi:hypothetical protein
MASVRCYLFLVFALATGPEGEPPNAGHSDEDAEAGRRFGNLVGTIGHADDVSSPATAIATFGSAVHWAGGLDKQASHSWPTFFAFSYAVHISFLRRSQMLGP